MNELNCIDPEKMYIVSELAEQLKIGKRALREARKQGLAIRYWGNRSYVLGRDVIAHITQHGRDVR